MDATVTWALPVKADKLGAHLQAYVETLDAIIALRLCNRFGTGPGTAVQKLPVELVTMIEKVVFQETCKEKLPEWELDFACFEHKCDGSLSSHMTREEMLDIWYRFELGQEECYSDAEDGSDDPDGNSSHAFKPLTDERLRRIIDDEWDCEYMNFDSEDDIHREREADWSNRTTLFEEHRELLKRNFGVDVWTSDVRLDRHHWRHDEPAHTTVTYLTLPARPQREFEWVTSAFEDEYPGECASISTGHGIPIELGKTPSAASLRRFPRAIELLDLKVFLHKTQAGRPLGPLPSTPDNDEGGNKAAKRVTRLWSVKAKPQLTLPLRGSMSP
nr:hypothetical protein B0A51_11570 [Rachicladosporium sp. CCFEE 5018]